MIEDGDPNPSPDDQDTREVDAISDDSMSDTRELSSRSFNLEPTPDIGFRNDFPGGNGLVSFRVSLDEGPTIVELTAQARGSAAPLWFHTYLTGLAGESVHLRIANALQMNGDDRAWAGNAIVLRDGDHPWKRTSLPIIEDDAAGVARVIYPLNIAHERCEIAWCFPYQREDLRQTVRECRIWQPARIGRTGDGRVIERYRLHSRYAGATADQSVGEAMKRRRKHRAVYILCGHGAGETAANWVLDGMMRSAALDDELNRRIRHLEFWAIPFVDVDGQESGRYGRGIAPGEFDRAWTSPPGRTEVRAVMLDLERWAMATEPALVINLQGTSHEDRAIHLIAHESGQDENARNVCALLQDQLRPIADPRLQSPDRTIQQIGGLTPGFESLRGAWPEWVHRHLECATMTIAVSMQGSPDENYEISHYRRIGHAIVKSVVDSLLG